MENFIFCAVSAISVEEIAQTFKESFDNVVQNLM